MHLSARQQWTFIGVVALVLVAWAWVASQAVTAVRFAQMESQARQEQARELEKRILELENGLRQTVTSRWQVTPQLTNELSTRRGRDEPVEDFIERHIEAQERAQRWGH